MKILFTLVFSLLLYPLFAQEKIYTKSRYNYIYKVSYEQAKKIYKADNLSGIDKSYLTLLVDSFPSNQWRPSLAPGNYLILKAEENEVIIEAYTQSKLIVNVLNNHTDLDLTIHDTEGLLIKDAIVKINGKKILFNDKSHSYHLQNSNKKGFLEVQHPKGNLFFDLNRHFDSPLLLRNLSNIIVQKPVSFIQKKLRRRYNGYLVFNKPKYLPKDTVKLKAFLVKNNKPLTLPLELALGPDGEPKQTIAVLLPVSNGAYMHEFVLGDTLDINTYYEVRLSNSNQKKRMVVQNVFYLEDYQLDEAVYEISTDQNNYHYNEPVSLVITSRDANGLPLQDAKATITVKTNSITNFYDNEQHIGFTLWTHQQELDPDGETKILIPDSIFPDANIRVSVKAQLSNSNYEGQEIETSFSYDKKPKEKIVTSISTTKIKAVYYKDGKETNSKGHYYTFPGSGFQSINFPYEEEINPYVREYTFFDEGKNYGYAYLNNQPHLVEGFSKRTKDSALFELNNPRQLDIYYSVYKNKKKIKTGKVKELKLAYEDEKENDYSVSLQFIWAGTSQTLDYCICHDTQKLHVKISQPAQVLPGEKNKITIEILDHLDHPVKDVNLTAFSVNSQLGEVEIPEINFGILPDYKGRQINSFHTNQINPYKGNKLINHEWRNKLHLDSQAFYKLMFPDSDGFSYAHPSTVPQTQFAPFVFKKGLEVKVYMIKVDGKLLYFNSGENKERYSFPVEPGKHSLSLRTYDKEIFIPQILIEANRKTYLSFDLGNLTKSIMVETRSPKLSKEEIKLLNDHFIVFNSSYETVYLTQGNKIYSCKEQKSVVGPFEEGAIKAFKRNQIQYEFKKDPFLVYGFNYSDSLTLDTINAASIKYKFHNYKLLKQYRHFVKNDHYNDLAYTQKDIDKEFQSDKYFRHKEDNAEYTEKEKGSVFILLKMLYGRMILYNDKDTFTVYHEAPLYYNLSPGTYSFRGYNKDTLKYSKDSIKVLPQSIYLLRTSDSLYSHYRDPDGNEPSTYNRGEFKWSRYSTDSKHYLQKISRPFYVKPYHLITLNLIPDIFETKRKYTLVGLSSKASFFHGDVPSTTGAGLGIHLISKFSPRFAMRKEFSFARIGGSGVGMIPKYRYPDTLTFRNNLWQYSASLIFDLVPNKGRYQKRLPVNLYGSIGLGILYSNPQRLINGEWVQGRINSVHGYYPKMNFYLPLGGGIRFKISNHTDLEADWTYNFMFTEYLEDATSFVNATGKDAFSLLSLRMNYLIPQRVATPKFRTPRYRHEDDGNYWGIAGPSDAHPGSSSTITGMAYSEENGFEVAGYSTGQADQDIPYPGEAQSHKYSNTDDLNPLRRNGGYIYGDLVKGQITSWDLNPTYLDFGDLSRTGTGHVRKDFRDYGYWEPNLITNDSGKVSFEVVFPGNITKWNSYVLAMNGRQSGKAFTSTRSFKPLVSSLYVPRFMIEGDEAYINGKSLNYTGDTLAISSAFVVGNDSSGRNRQTLIRALSERHKVSALTEDTLKVTYTTRLSNGYSDGEERIIPVFRKGIEETKGTFMMLPKDTSISLSFDTTLGPVTIFVDNNTIDVLLKEIDNVQDYPYYCMEQTASKLEALLMEKNIRKQLNQPFNRNAEIKSLIKKLRKGQNDDHTWGWWEGSPTDYYMTLHIAKVLFKAQSSGFETPSIGNSLNIYKYRGGNSYEDIGLQLRYFNTLTDLGAKLDYKIIIDSAEKVPLSLHEKLELMRLKQIHQQKYDLNELLKEKKQTFLGSTYWGEEGYDLYHNSIQTTLLAYDILRREGNYEKELQGIRNYFMEQRKNGSWRNTYESAKILEMILTDVLKDSENQSSRVAINYQSIQKFPHKEDLKGNTLSIDTKGPMVYLTAYQSSWNSHPEKQDKDFKVETKFMNEGKLLDSLTTGQNVTMEVKVNNKKEGRYVMIEIPIPAGCTYDQKTFALNVNEVHREYFKDKVVIFCEQLPAGENEFSLILQPRFSGQFTINPAKVELMYFPVFNGRNEMKRIKILE